MGKETKKIVVNKTGDGWPLLCFCEMMEAASEEAGSSLAGADYHEQCIGEDDILFNVSVVGLPDGGIIRVHPNMIIGNVTTEQFAELKKIAVDCCGEDAIEEIEVEEADLAKKNFAIFYFYDEENEWGNAVENKDFCGCLRVTEEQAAAYILKWDKEEVEHGPFDSFREHVVKLVYFDFHEDDFLDVEAY